MQLNLGLKGSQKGGNTIRKKRKIIYFSCIGYMYFRWFWTEQGKSYSGSRTCRGRKSPSSEQTSAYSFFFVTETCAWGGIPTLLVSIIARAGHTGVCPGTKAWSCAGNLSESVQRLAGMICLHSTLNNPGNSNSEGKRKTVRVNGVDCKIQFAILKIDIYWFFSTSVYFLVQCNLKLISSETVIWFGICMIGVICSLYQLKSNWCMSSVDQSGCFLRKGTS